MSSILGPRGRPASGRTGGGFAQPRTAEGEHRRVPPTSPAVNQDSGSHDAPSQSAGPFRGTRPGRGGRSRPRPTTARTPGPSSPAHSGHRPSRLVHAIILATALADRQPRLLRTDSTSGSNHRQHTGSEQQRRLTRPFDRAPHSRRCALQASAPDYTPRPSGITIAPGRRRGPGWRRHQTNATRRDAANPAPWEPTARRPQPDVRREALRHRGREVQVGGGDSHGEQGSSRRPQRLPLRPGRSATC
jgi:hypothetical protein